MENYREIVQKLVPGLLNIFHDSIGSPDRL